MSSKRAVDASVSRRFLRHPRQAPRMRKIQKAYNAVKGVRLPTSLPLFVVPTDIAVGRARDGASWYASACFDGCIAG